MVSGGRERGAYAGGEGFDGGCSGGNETDMEQGIACSTIGLNFGWVRWKYRRGLGHVWVFDLGACRLDGWKMAKVMVAYENENG